jgi:hypothetical protein
VYGHDGISAYTSGAERLRITSDGKLGLGTTSPGSTLEVNATAPVITVNSAAANASSIEFKQAGTLYGRVRFDGNNFDIGNLYSGGATIINAGNAERARIDSSGRLLVGTSTASDYYGTTAKAYIIDQGGSTIPLALETFRSDSAGAYLVLSKSRASTAGTFTVVQGNDTLGLISFNGADGTDLQSIGAQISAQVDGTPGADDMPGRLVFSTTADGASSPTERMRIDSGGGVRIATTSSLLDSSSRLSVNGAIEASRSDNEPLLLNRGNSDGIIVRFYRSISTVGTISVTTTATAYNTSSDYRLKENVVPLTGAADRLKLIPVHRFNFIADPSKTVDGFIAHEAQAVVPECVTGTKDEVDDDGNPVYQGIDQSKLVPLLTAALQEAIGRIETLEAEVAALKGA